MGGPCKITWRTGSLTPLGRTTIKRYEGKVCVTTWRRYVGLYSWAFILWLRYWSAHGADKELQVPPNRPSHKWKNNFRKCLCTESLWRCEPDKYGSVAGSDMRCLSQIMNRRARRTELHYQLSDSELHKNSNPRGYRATPWAHTLTMSLLRSTVKVAISSNKWPGNPYSPEITWEGRYISLLLPAAEEPWVWLL